MTKTPKTYDELAAIDQEETERDRARVLHMLGLLTPNMSGLEILVLHGDICNDKEVWKLRAASDDGIMLDPLDVLQKMKPSERAALRTRIAQ
jgi:hypothetical protein